MESENTTDDEKLFNSSRGGDLEGVVNALAQGGRVAMKNHQGATPLLTAALNGHTDICGLLLEHGSDVAMRNHQGFTPLLAAAQNGHTDICGLLLAHGSNGSDVNPETKWTALHDAAARGHEAVVEALLSWGAIVDPQDDTGTTPLYAACQNGHLACVLALLKAQARVSMADDYGNLPIHVAAQVNRVEIIRALLDYGCSPDMVSCCDNIFTTILLSFLLLAEQPGRVHTTHECSIRSI